MPVGETGGVWEETCLFIYDEIYGYWGSGGGIFLVCICIRERKAEREKRVCELVMCIIHTQAAISICRSTSLLSLE